MIQYTLTIIAKEPLVLRAQSGSEIQSDVVDYIQGTKILGILAKKTYKDLKEKDVNIVHDLFHSGNVSFGNAYPMYKDNESFPVPFSMHKAKNSSKYVLSPSEEIDQQQEKIEQQQETYQQQKEGYVSETDDGLILFYVPTGERLKSARNLASRRSEDEQMYLYSFLKRGVQFQSIITIKKSIEGISKILQKLDGKHYIGTSKGEFGLIEIQVSEKEQVAVEEPVKKKELTIYAASDLLFLNEFGRYTTAVEPHFFNIENAVLNRKKSFIQFKYFHTYNSKRKCNDADRIAIKKGSILVFESVAEDQKIVISSETIQFGVGVHKSEGFGRILVDPSFLKKKNIKVFKKDIGQNVVFANKKKEGDLQLLLSARHELVESDRETYREAERFVKQHGQKTFKNTKKSQWGAIRSYVLEAISAENPKQTLKDKLFNEKKGYLRKKSNANWNDKQIQIIKQLFNKENCVELLLKISVELPKTLKND